MGRRRGTRDRGGPRLGAHAARPAGAGAGPTPGGHLIDTGVCRLVRDRDGRRMWTLEVNGFPSSHVDLDDPEWLAFPYMYWVAELAETHLVAHPVVGPARFLHLGGAGCSLARHFLAVSPETQHLAVEVDGRLAELVREWFDLPRAPRLRIRVGEARETVSGLAEASRDVVIRDVFVGEVTPEHLTTREFAAGVRRVLAAAGVYLVNCVDTRDLRVVRREAATLRSVFPHVALVSEAGTLKRRRRGNLVLAASAVPLDHSDALRARLRAGGVRVDLRVGADVAAFAGDAQVLTD